VLVVLAARDEPSLARLCDAATDAGHQVVRFFEPDLGDSLTAAAFAPSARRLLARLPLALRGEVRT
jgi:hypothetical protein